MSKFTLIKNRGVIPQARLLLSPNFDRRPDPDEVSLLVIHNISLPPGKFGGNEIAEFFCNQLDSSRHPFFSQIKDMKVSAHLLIDRKGALTQFVPLHKRAWHAGQSCFAGREECNDFSIGIELEGGDNTPYTKEQYKVLADVTHLIMQHYPAITRERITGHNSISPGRKTDPGPAFDWPRYRKNILP
ncbi:MAG: 1,6-anhydro-N-acetylmuramyl-L-alanine amidase AmpD [Gammaproteobacteria bacterium]|nr:1,6-anhydro-N-acetylmuramyl-L-alanine amidase AmpD [Gammaproteobacteria bacterium]MCF6231021.1 1,6-anhydro-N-acetylmuramyl-L-alanine amidase AmpD [Gammaproteobacteria bacterium]